MTELITCDETVEEILRFFGKDKGSLELSCHREQVDYFYPIYRQGVEAILNKFIQVYFSYCGKEFTIR